MLISDGEVELLHDGVNLFGSESVNELLRWSRIRHLGWHLDNYRLLGVLVEDVAVLLLKLHRTQRAVLVVDVHEHAVAVNQHLDVAIDCFLVQVGVFVYLRDFIVQVLVGGGANSSDIKRCSLHELLSEIVLES